ncbi:PTS transporter subunit EIIC [Spiroplasma sp. SV19]|uniref:PTS sugar transporter subunit IIC n=1 Tax=Spiroplasma sp. SV19 TaxID=2570468 RepID=UPI0024B7609C|nr:PTS transporter subunit EIIC [Spiroplasma sp. SV19]WHQ36377.1 hypothetical protein E7Y35_00235 [Spiroplasma sp. SV19]
MGESIVRKPSKFTTWINNKFIPVVEKIGNQTHLSIIRDSFALITPLFIAGALAIFIDQIILGSSVISLSYWIAYWSKMYEGFDGDNIIFLSNVGKTFDALKSVNGVVWNASLMVMTLYIVFLIGYLLGKRREQDPAIIAGIVSFATFIVAGAGIAGWEFAQKFMGVDGLFSGIIVAFLSAELFIFLQRNNRLTIRMPKNIPPAVGHAFAKLLPMIITTFLFGIVSQLLIWAPIEYTVIDQFKQEFINQDNFGGIYRNTHGEMFQLLNGTLQPLTNVQTALVTKIEYLTMTSDSIWGAFGSLDEITTEPEYSTFNLNFKTLTLVTLIYKFFTYPFMNVAANPNIGLGLALLYIFFASIFWFFGLHGTNIMNGIFGPIWLYATVQNSIAFKAGQNLPFIFSLGFFDAFIFLGGWGMSLGLILITLIMGRDKQTRTVSKKLIVPTIFNIDEPVTFAYPLFLNPVLVIPSIIGSLLLVIWTWFWISIGVVPGAALLIPWMAPVGIGAFITTGSWKGIILAFSNLILMVVLYIPFILIANRIAKNNGTTVSLNYLGRIQFLLIGRNYAEPQAKELRLRQRVELKQSLNPQERRILKERHRNEWKTLHNELVAKYRQVRHDKKRARQFAKQNRKTSKI